MSKEDEAGIPLWIASVPHAFGGPSVCLITWGALQWPAPVADVRATALDMITCAAYAEMMMGILRLGMPARSVTGFTADLIRRTGRVRFGTPATVELAPAGSARRGTAAVRLERGGQRGDVDSDTARSMAAQWLTAAEATEGDRALAAALEAAGVPELEERLFAGLRAIRAMFGGGDPGHGENPLT